MKKINYLLIAAIASLTVASCQKEQAEQFTPAGQGAGQEFTVSLPEVTKTDLVEGKTVWAKNDSLWISNGTLTEKIGEVLYLQDERYHDYPRDAEHVCGLSV